MFCSENIINPRFGYFTNYLPMNLVIFPGTVLDADLVGFVEARRFLLTLMMPFDITMIKKHQPSENGRAARLKIKSINTVIKSWPLRLKETAQQEEFEVVCATGHN